MNQGVEGLSNKPRVASEYVVGPHAMVSATVQTYDLPAGRRWGAVQARLLCVTANNGYVVGEEIPLELVYYTNAINRDGVPRWSWSIRDSQLKFVILSTNVEIVDATGTFGGTFTLSQWQIKFYVNA
jgi:hypothetical protein